MYHLNEVYPAFSLSPYPLPSMFENMSTCLQCAMFYNIHIMYFLQFVFKGFCSLEYKGSKDRTLIKMCIMLVELKKLC